MSSEIGRTSVEGSTVTPQTASANNAVTTPLRPSSGTASGGAPNPELQSKLDSILLSDIGIETLLGRVKQSISTAREFSSFLRERSVIEEKHAQNLRRLARSNIDSARRPENRHGTYARGLEELNSVNDRIAENGLQFANSLHNMSDELRDQAENTERGRKHWKHNALDAEKRVQEAEFVMMRSKDKYYNTAEQYDRVKTGEKQPGKFGLKSKSAAQQEESLKEKVDQLDHEYSSKVDSAQAQKQELVTKLRPEAVRALTELINECDAGLSFQMQKYASLSERHMVGNGVAISPLKGQANTSGPEPRSMRQIVQNIDNQKDFQDYVLGFSQGAVQPSAIKYEKHPALASISAPIQPSYAVGQQSVTTPQQSPAAAQQSFGMSHQSPSGSRQGYPTQDPYATPNYHSRGPSGQISGVTSYDQAGRNQYDPHSHQRSGSGAPQLPQFGPGQSFRDSFEQGRPDDDFIKAATQPKTTTSPDVGRSQVPPFAMHQQQQPSVDTGRGQASPITAHQQQQPFDAGRGQTSPLAMHQQQPIEMGRGQTSPLTSHPQPQPLDAGRGQMSPIATQQQPQQPQQYGGVGRGFPTGAAVAAGAVGAGVMGAAAMGSGRGAPSGDNMNAASDAERGELSGSNMNAPIQEKPTPANGATGSPWSQNQTPVSPPPQYGTLPGPGPNRGLPSQQYPPPAGRGAMPPMAGITGPGRPNLPPLRPVFGVSLDELFHRDGSAVPLIVYQCVKAIETYGLNTPYIYRTSGSAPFIMHLKAKFDNDASKVDLARGPSEFNHDISSVATLLKNFLRDLPDPVFTSAAYHSLIQAARIEEDTVRRDSLHQIINSLPDPNYATLRLLVLHLNRVAANAERNSMTTNDLAIVFAPTLLRAHSGGDVRDAAWQAKVVQTVVDNTLQIFDEDDE